MGIVGAALTLVAAGAAKVDLPKVRKPRRKRCSRLAERLEGICERVILQRHQIAALERQILEANETIGLLRGALIEVRAELIRERRETHDQSMRLYQQHI